MGPTSRRWRVACAIDFYAARDAEVEVVAHEALVAGPDDRRHVAAVAGHVDVDLARARRGGGRRRGAGAHGAGRGARGRRDESRDSVERPRLAIERGLELLVGRYFADVLLVVDVEEVERLGLGGERADGLAQLGVGGAAVSQVHAVHHGAAAAEEF